MNMGFIDKELKRLISSFRFAITGIVHVFKQERNMQIHVVIAGLVLLFASLLSISKLEWIIIFVCIGIVISLECINTAIERCVDLCTDEYKLLAKQAKDAAAGAVFVFAIISVIIAIIIFGKPLLKWLNLM